MIRYTEVTLLGQRAGVNGAKGKSEGAKPK